MDEMYSVRLASLSPRLQAVPVLWLKHEGEHLERGEPLYIVDSQKGAIEVRSEVEGTIERLLVPEGAEANAGQEIALIRLA
ncbi:MAG: lipoyl domain-containing protein [Chloroflexi bacterium]|nr:lipoyl domain-containing protein [Chloroflexota bacterium]